MAPARNLFLGKIRKLHDIQRGLQSHHPKIKQHRVVRVGTDDQHREQRGLACDAEVRHSGARPHRCVTIVVFAWWNPCIIRPHCAADQELEESCAAGPALQLSLLQDTSDWPPFVLLCRAADVQRSGPGPGRRAHEAVQHQTQFLDHVLCLGIIITRLRCRASSPSRSSPTPASLVKTRSRHTS